MKSRNCSDIFLLRRKHGKFESVKPVILEEILSNFCFFYGIVVIVNRTKHVKNRTTGNGLILDKA